MLVALNPSLLLFCQVNIIFVICSPFWTEKCLINFELIQHLLDLIDISDLNFLPLYFITTIHLLAAF